MHFNTPQNTILSSESPPACPGSAKRLVSSGLPAQGDFLFSASEIKVPFSHLVQGGLVRVLGIDFCVQPSALEFVLGRQLHSSSFDLHLLVGQPGERHHGVIYSLYEFFLPRACIRGLLSAEAVRSLGRQYIYHFGVHTRFIRIPNFSLVLAAVDGLAQCCGACQEQQT